jgi:hypothetical protein
VSGTGSDGAGIGSGCAGGVETASSATSNVKSLIIGDGVITAGAQNGAGIGAGYGWAVIKRKRGSWNKVEEECGMLENRVKETYFVTQLTFVRLKRRDISTFSNSDCLWEDIFSRPFFGFHL